MPYLRVKFGSHEIERRDLSTPLVIGRSPDCDIAVRDVLLSRRHCRIEPLDGRTWQAVDIGSKNGTTFNDEPLAAPVLLSDGDELRLGRVTVRFRAGRLADAGLMPLKAVPLRPADPTEALSATFAGFAFLEPGESAPLANHPRPQPSPRPPAAYQREDIYGFISTIVSSSWDSIYAEARRPLPAFTVNAARMATASRPRFRPRSPIDLSLEAFPRSEPTLSRPRSRRPRARRQLFVASTWIIVLLALLTKALFDGHAPLAPRPAVAAVPVVTARANPDLPEIVWDAGGAFLPILL
jgi:pSer/pThr/pTyr-binding forkhead associated (FHA) protein